MEQKNQITEGVIWKQLLIFFFPIVIGTFFQQIYNTADSIVVGRFVGKEALAAVGGSVNQIVMLIVEVFVGLTSGASVIMAQFYGAKDITYSLCICNCDRCSGRYHGVYDFTECTGYDENTLGTDDRFHYLSAYLFLWYDF